MRQLERIRISLAGFPHEKTAEDGFHCSRLVAVQFTVGYLETKLNERRCSREQLFHLHILAVREFFLEGKGRDDTSEMHRPLLREGSAEFG